MNRKELIKKYLEFFESKGHKIIPSASLVPENDPTVLFTTAGMHPLVPYLLGMKHPLGKRIANVQKCIRTTDIDEVGDTTHHTFFEMLGNWSMGDYFKKEAIEWSFEFLTKVLKIPIERLAVSVFKGDESLKVQRDEEAAKIWLSLGIPKERIAFLPKEDNWWGPAGKTGPCGPDTEMFYWKDNSTKPPKSFEPEEKKWVEIWNDVLMQYIKNEKGEYVEAKQKNVDTGMGVERTVAVLNGLDDNYLSDLWVPIIKEIEKLSGKKYSSTKANGANDENITRAMRIIADHIKAAVFIISDGISPSNTERGYILRRLIRRAVRYGKELGLKNFTKNVAEPVFKIYENDYSELKNNKNKILESIETEEKRFLETIEKGEREFEKKTEIFPKMQENIEKTIKPIIETQNFNKGYIQSLISMQENIEKTIKPVLRLYEGIKRVTEPIIKMQESIRKATEPIIKMQENLSGKEAFLLYQSYGFPLELTKEIAKEKNIPFNEKDFEQELKKHQELSRTATKGKFAAGLADHSEQSTKYHTATHMLHRALKMVLGNEVQQMGSNITPERLRFDFKYDKKMTPEEIKKVEGIVNEQIKRGLNVSFEEMPYEKAIKSGALSYFRERYPPIVKVYTVGDFSKEICTGPHVTNTKNMGKFKIIKEESVSAGVRRIKAVLE